MQERKVPDLLLGSAHLDLYTPSCQTLRCCAAARNLRKCQLTGSFCPFTKSRSDSRVLMWPHSVIEPELEFLIPTLQVRKLKLREAESPIAHKAGSHPTIHNQPGNQPSIPKPSAEISSLPGTQMLRNQPSSPQPNSGILHLNSLTASGSSWFKSKEEGTDRYA